MVNSERTQALDIKVGSNKRVHMYFGKYKYAVKVEFPWTYYRFSYDLSRNTVTLATFIKEQRQLVNLPSITQEEIDQYMHVFDDLVDWINTNRSNFRAASAGVDHVIFYLTDERTVKEFLSTLPAIITVSVYSKPYTNTATVPQLCKIPCCVTVTRATGEPVAKGAIALNDPKYKFRTFFNSVALSEEQRNQLCQFLSSRRDLKLSIALTRWAVAPSCWNYYGSRTLHWFSVDHNDHDVTLLLELTIPGVIRKTVPIVKRKQKGESSAS